MAVSSLDEAFLSVVEAASLLRVAPSTIRRWIREGRLPASRVGQRRVALRLADVEGMVRPAAVGPRDGADAGWEGSTIPRPTAEDRRRGLAALARVERIAERIHGRRGGNPFPPAWETLDDLRAERAGHLP